MIRINTFTGALEQDNDRVCESTYETEVCGGGGHGCRYAAMCCSPEEQSACTANQAEALDALRATGYEPTERGHALLGYAGGAGGWMRD